VEGGERELRHAAVILHYFTGMLERGWRHSALDYDFCVAARRRLQRMAGAGEASDSAFLRRLADMCVAVEPTAFATTASALRRFAAAAEAVGRDHLT
jgi:hypothetical protein